MRKNHLGESKWKLFALNGMIDVRSVYSILIFFLSGSEVFADWI